MPVNAPVDGDLLLVAAVEVRAPELSVPAGVVQAAAALVDRHADRLAHAAHQDLTVGPARGRRARGDRDGRAADRVVAAIGPVDRPRLEIELHVDRLGEPAEQHLDVGAVRRRLPGGHLDVGAADGADARVVAAFLRPVEPAARGVERHADAPAALVHAIGRAAAGRHQRLDAAAVDVGALDAHPFAIRPVQLAAGRIDAHLLRRVRSARGHQRDDVAAVQIRAPHEAVVARRVAHPRPEDVARGEIDGDAVRSLTGRSDQIARHRILRRRRHDRAADVEEEDRRRARGRAARARRAGAAAAAARSAVAAVAAVAASAVRHRHCRRCCRRPACRFRNRLRADMARKGSQSRPW